MNAGSDTLRERVLAAAIATPSTTRRAGRLLAVLAIALSTGVAFALFELFGGLAHSRDRPLGQTVRLADGWALASAVLAWIVLGRGGSTLARSPPVLLMATAASPIALYAWMQHFPVWKSPPDGEVACLSLTVAIAAVPLASFLMLRRGLQPSHPGILGGAAGAMSGAWAAVLVLLWCPETDGLHALVGHVLPLVLLIALGAKIGASTLGLRKI